jgi:hypothetical protein
MPSLLLALVLSAAPAAAQASDCNAKTLAKELTAASPVQVSRLFQELARCDAAAALKVAPTELLRVLPGSDGDASAVVAVDIGATDALLKWMGGMESKDKARTIAALGDACDAHPKVKDFLVGAQARLGDQYWTERWYRALASCEGPEVGAILAAELDKGSGADKTRYFGILQTYARSQGAGAIPKLQELAGRFTDVESLTYIVQAFPDAARVGSEQGRDETAARAAVTALVALAPSLPEKVVEAARVALQALGDEAAADALAGERYRAVRQPDGGLLWGVVAVESAPCKKGSQTWRRVHHAQVTDPGRTWPDQLQDKVQAAAATAWQPSLGAKCKAEATITWTLPAEPFADEAAFGAWRDEQLKEIDKTTVDKSWTLAWDPLAL